MARLKKTINAALIDAIRRAKAREVSRRESDVDIELERSHVGASAQASFEQQQSVALCHAVVTAL